MPLERIGILEAQFTAHLKADEVGFERINADTTKIMGTLDKIETKLDASLERVHTRIDDAKADARHALNNESAISRAQHKSAMDFTQEAHNRIGEEAAETQEQILGLKLWAIGAVGTFAVGGLVWIATEIAKKLMG